MIAIDTNIVLRLILGDDLKQIAAIRRIMVHETVFISLTVLLEVGWVLASRYRLPRVDVATALSSILALEGVEASRPAIARWAIERYRCGADWADMVHLVSASKIGGFATLDQRLAKSAGMDAPVVIETLA